MSATFGGPSAPVTDSPSTDLDETVPSTESPQVPSDDDAATDTEAGVSMISPADPSTTWDSRDPDLPADAVSVEEFFS